MHVHSWRSTADAPNTDPHSPTAKSTTQVLPLHIFTYEVQVAWLEYFYRWACMQLGCSIARQWHAPAAAPDATHHARVMVYVEYPAVRSLHQQLRQHQLFNCLQRKEQQLRQQRRHNKPPYKPHSTVQAPVAA
jgi:hypothetical protein